MFDGLINFRFPYTGLLASEVRQSKTCPLKTFEFSISFTKNSTTKNFRPSKISAPVNKDVANAAKQ